MTYLLRRDNRGNRAVGCEWPGCDFRSASGITMQAHVQRVHISRNDLPQRVDGRPVFPADWWKGGAVTDRVGRREAAVSLGRQVAPVLSRKYPVTPKVRTWHPHKLDPQPIPPPPAYAMGVRAQRTEKHWERRVDPEALRPKVVR